MSEDDTLLIEKSSNEDSSREDILALIERSTEGGITTDDVSSCLEAIAETAMRIEKLRREATMADISSFVEASRETDIKRLYAPQAKRVNCSDCTALKTLKVPADRFLDFAGGES